MRSLVSASLVRVSRALAYVGAACVIGMLSLICADVFARTIFDKPLPAVVEIVSSWFMVGIVFLPLALIGYGRTHIAVETFTVGLSPSRLRMLDRAVSLIGAAFFGVLAYAGIEPAVAATRIGETTSATVFDLPIWPVHWGIIIACAAAALVELFNAFGLAHRNE